MRPKLLCARACLLLTLCSLPCASGCAVFVQNKYSVFGFEALQTQSPEQARAMSLALLTGVAIVAAGLGAAAMWLVGARGRRKTCSSDPYTEGVIAQSPESP